MKRPKLPAIFRWQYVGPRLFVVTALYLSVRYGLDPALRWAMIATGEAALGARVEVAGVRTSLRGGEIVITGVAAANPTRPMRNLLEASQTRLHVDAAQLLRKRLVVRDGSITGLQFGSPRSVSGALESTPASEVGPSALDPVIAAAQGKAIAWLDDLTGRMEHDLTAALATPKLLEELRQRWPRQYSDLKARAEALRVRSKEIEAAFREIKKNPLRGMAELDRLGRELAAAEAELRATIAEIEALPAQTKADRLAVDEARKRDEQFLREHLQLTGIDARDLNEYLLGEAVGGRLQQATYWIEQARRLIPKGKMAPPTRTRGTNVLFGLRRQPACLIERVELAGDARLDGQRLLFTGQLTDAASEPHLHDRPMRISLVGSGALAGRLHVELDRRGDAPRDSLTIDVPRLMLAGRTLGRADKLAVTVAPGEGSLKAEVRLDGERLSGVIHWKQSSTLSAATPMLRDDRIAAVFQQSLGGVDRLEATVRLAGTLKRPDFDVESNVGPQLAAAVNGSVRNYLTDRKERLLAKIEAQVDGCLSQLEAQRQQAQAELMASLGENQQAVTQLAALLKGQSPLEAIGMPNIGRSLNLDKLRR